MNAFRGLIGSRDGIRKRKVALRMRQEPLLLSRLQGRLRRSGANALASQVTVASSRAAHGERTSVRIDHRLREPGSRGARVRWRITTRDQFLPRAHFARAAREKINAASLDRGRRIYCVDLESQQVMAALSYHLDDREHWPLLLTALALRIDEDATADLFEESRALGWLLKQYVHAIGEKVGRAGYVDMDAPDRRDVVDELMRLGFRNAPRVDGLNPSGRHLRQDAI